MDLRRCRPRLRLVGRGTPDDEDQGRHEACPFKERDADTAEAADGICCQRTVSRADLPIPWPVATGSYTMFPPTTLTPSAKAGSARTASFHPRSAMESTYGKVALTSAWVDEWGTAPGILDTQYKRD